MKNIPYNNLQIRELFHLEFLRWFSRKIKAENYAVKGGTNLRFFFQSLRYSEDMDLDAWRIGVDKLKDAVMAILTSSSFQDTLKPFGIEKVIPPDITRAKQTETTQRFKAHLITLSGEDLFTKLEFSRRGLTGEVVVEPVLDSVLRVYKLAPLLVPHYNVQSAVIQKLNALGSRAVIQARDIFDLYILIPQLDNMNIKELKFIKKDKISKAYENLFEVDFEEFKDTVVSYLNIEEQSNYGNPSSWEELRLKVADFIEGLHKKDA